MTRAASPVWAEWGVAEAEAIRWEAKGWRADTSEEQQHMCADAIDWKLLGLDPDTAEEWDRHVGRPEWARPWLEAGYRPDDAGGLVSVALSLGVDPASLGPWARTGLPVWRIAAALQAGLTPAETTPLPLDDPQVDQILEGMAALLRSGKSDCA